MGLDNGQMEDIVRSGRCCRADKPTVLDVAAGPILEQRPAVLQAVAAAAGIGPTAPAEAGVAPGPQGDWRTMRVEGGPPPFDSDFGLPMEFMRNDSHSSSNATRNWVGLLPSVVGAKRRHNLKNRFFSRASCLDHSDVDTTQETRGVHGDLGQPPVSHRHFGTLSEPDVHSASSRLGGLSSRFPRVSGLLCRSTSWTSTHVAAPCLCRCDGGGS